MVGLWDAFDRMSQAHDPLLALDEFSSHKNVSSHHQTPPPHLAPAHITTPILANISEAVKKYGSEGQSGQGPGKAGSAAPRPATAPPPPDAGLKSEVPSPIKPQSSSGKAVPVGQPSPLVSAFLPGGDPLSSDVPSSASLSEVVSRTESPKSAAQSGTVPSSESSNSGAARDVPPGGSASGMSHSAGVVVPKAEAASPLPTETAQAPPT